VAQDGEGSALLAVRRCQSTVYEPVGFKRRSNLQLNIYFFQSNELSTLPQNKYDEITQCGFQSGLLMDYYMGYQMKVKRYET